MIVMFSVAGKLYLFYKSSFLSLFFDILLNRGDMGRDISVFSAGDIQSLVLGTVVPKFCISERLNWFKGLGLASFFEAGVGILWPSSCPVVKEASVPS